MSTADPVQAFEDLAATCGEVPGAGRRRMFGRDTLTVDGHIHAFRHQDRVAFRLPPALAADLLERGDAVVPDMGKRSMEGWVALPLSDDPSEREEQARLLAEAVIYVRAQY
jgi:TfoX/Sxy family transcriptional regulator of competence genes